MKNTLIEMNVEYWMSIIDELSKLEVIKTKWNTGQGRDSIAGVMTTKTNLKIISNPLSHRNYEILRTVINPT